MQSFTVVDAQNLAHLRGALDVVLVTATPVELAAVRRLLAPLPDGQIYKVFVHSETYYIGTFGSHTVVVVKCEMGTAGRDGALAVCTSALHVWRPRAAIMIGIAFGKDPKHQRMCDVLVANSIIPYELAKVGARYVTRSPHPPTNGLLLNRFTNATDWSLKLGRSSVAMRIGPLLTGEKVLDNAAAKAKLFKQFPHAIGGEMEGAGLFAAADRLSTPWIVVKAICDWADGTKHDKAQPKAATAAASLVHYVLSEQGSLDALPPPSAIRDSDPFRPASSALRIPAASESGPTVASSAPQSFSVPPPAEQADHVAVHTTALPAVIGRNVAVLDVQVSAVRRGPRRQPVRVIPTLLTGSELHALRLIASAPVKLPSLALSSLFPRVDWRQRLASLRRKGVVDTNEPQPLGIARSVVARVFEGATHARYEAMWLKRLEALREHIDTAVLLGLLHLNAKRYDDAVEALTDIAEGLEPGFDNSFYRGLLQHLMTPRLERRLAVERQVHLLNAFALCVARDGEHEASLPYYARLRRLSQKSGNAWGVGQSFINSGVSYFYLGNIPKARKSYELAIAHARRTRDRWLEARALQNLGTIVAEESPERGIALIERSLALKLENGDGVGVAGAFLGHGNIHAHAGRSHQALEAYSNAIDIARQLDLRHLLGLALSNAGSAHVDLGEPDKALAFYREARELAEREGFRDVRRFAVQGEAVAYNRLDRYKRSMASFLTLAELHNADSNRKGRLTALHDAGVMAAHAGEKTRSKRVLTQALRLAMSEREQGWIFRCHLAITTLTIADDKPAVERGLRAAAAATSSSGQHSASSRLWLVVLERLIERGADASEIERTARSALNECSRDTARETEIEVYKRLCIWRRDTDVPVEALKYAKLLERSAAAARKTFDRITAIDEQACCHQRLGKTATAERLHRKALSLAEQANDLEALPSPLVNLASLLRNTGRLAEARSLLERAATLATQRNDVALAATVAGNIALVLADSGQPVAARRLLESWRRKTAKLSMWPEHVLALHRLANLAYTTSRLERAEVLYGKALSEATRRNDPSQRDVAENFVSLLSERMRRAFSRNESPRAERTFERARKLAAKYSLTRSYRDLLFTLGDAQWRRGPRRYPSGLQAYLAACAEVSDMGAEEVIRQNGRAGAHIVLQFFRIPPSQSLGKVEKLVRRTEAWLRDQQKGESSKELEALICWPLVTGLKVAELVRGSRPPTADTVSQLVAKDFVAAWARWDSSR